MDRDEQLEREATVDEIDARKHQLESARLLPIGVAVLGGTVLLMGVYDRLTAWSHHRRRRRAFRRFARALHLR